MDKWEYKVLRGLSEDELNKWGEEGYEIFSIIPAEHTHYSTDGQDISTTVILKRRKP
jgi:hypothetical protein